MLLILSIFFLYILVNDEKYFCGYRLPGVGEDICLFVVYTWSSLLLTGRDCFEHYKRIFPQEINGCTYIPSWSGNSQRDNFGLPAGLAGIPGLYLQAKNAP